MTTTKKVARPKAVSKPRKKPVAKALARTKGSDPTTQGSRIAFLSPAQTSKVRVNEDTALTLGAVMACVRVVSESLAGLPWHPGRKLPNGGINFLYGSDVDWLLDVQPNSETAAFQWREVTVAHAMTWGNGYSEIEKNFAGEPAALWQITPDRVSPERFHGRIIYDIANPRGPNTVLEADEMYHLKGLGFDGLVGYSVIRYMARTIGMGIALEEAGSNFFANDSTPGGLLITEGALTDPARANLIQSWERRHGGPSNRRRIAILEQGLKWQATGLPPEDAQLVEQRQLTPTEVARWFRVPPHKIGDLTRSTNNNIEHQSIEFVNDTLRPWAERLESEADIKLFGRNNRGKVVTVLDLNELKRGDLASQTAFIEKVFDRGLADVDEGRAHFGWNPIGEAAGGKKRFVMMNMQLLETAGEEPPPPPPTDQPPPPPAENQTGDGSSVDLGHRQRVALAGEIEADCLELLSDTCSRMLKREEARARKMLETKAGDKLEATIKAFIAEHREYATKRLTPTARLLAKCHGGSSIAADVAVSLFLDKHLSDFGSFVASPIDRDPAAYTDQLVTCIKAAAAVKGAA